MSGSLIPWRHSILLGWVRRYSHSSSSRTLSSPSYNRHRLLHVDPEVSTALSSPWIHLRKPVLALESTIFAHGMPYPQNLQLAQELVSIIRSKGVIPAIIAIKNGVCRVGLTDEEVVDLTMAGEQGRAQKCSTRDLPLLLAKEDSPYFKSQKEEDRKIHKGEVTWGGTFYTRLALKRLFYTTTIVDPTTLLPTSYFIQQPL